MIDAADHREIHGLIVVAGIMLVVAWLWRLCQLDEEMDDYQNVYQLVLARRTGSEAIEQRRVVATQAGRNWLGVWIGDWWHGQSAVTKAAATPAVRESCAMASALCPSKLTAYSSWYLPFAWESFSAGSAFLNQRVPTSGNISSSVNLRPCCLGK